MGGIFSKPKQQKAQAMPDPEDPALKEARRQQVDRMKERGGRDSTILSDSLIGATGKLGA